MQHIDEELDVAMHSFLEGSACEVDTEHREVMFMSLNNSCYTTSYIPNHCDIL